MLLQHSEVALDQRGVIRPGFWRLGAATCSISLGFCSTILITRVLGPPDFGCYSFALWLATMTIPAIGVGLSAMSSRHIAEIQGWETPRFAAGIFHFIWKRQYYATLLYSLSYFLLVFPLSRLFGSNAPLLLLLLAGLSAPPLLLSGVVSITLRSLRRFDLLETLHLCGALVNVLLVIIATQVQEEQEGIMLLASAIARTVTLSLSLICLVRLLPLKEPLVPGSFLKGRLTRGFSNSFVLFTVDVIVWQRSELLLLGHAGTAAELGFYALSSMISTRVMNMAPGLLSTCVLPLLLRYVPSQRYTSLYDAYIKTNRYIVFLVLPICTLAILFCPLLVTLCFGEAYLPVVVPLRILLIPAAFGSVSTVSLTQLANSDRKQAQVRLGIGTAMLKIALSLPFIAAWGMTGAAIASAIAQVVSAVGSIAICHRLIMGKRGTITSERQ